MVAFITVEELLAPPEVLDAGVIQLRCVKVGDLSLTFESRRTVLAALQSIVATEGVSDPEALQAECDVYSGFLPGDGVSAQLTVQGPLVPLRGLEDHVQLVLGDVVRQAQFVGPLARTQRVRFSLEASDVKVLADPAVAVVLRTDHPHHCHAVALTDALRRALVEDWVCEA